ncbi:hypothetical protein Tco_0857287 [Tanacetum coccineum]|uniref:Reverse transcriptase domain-containing protein n=1 Tax=Tanacetum coccineum TaxID=301880 RepID=A0ABQ5B5T3_9ASTR
MLTIDDTLQFVEEPVEIMEREIKRLKRSRIPLVKVRWNSRRGPEFTWEREDSFKEKYPHLFTNRTSSSTTRFMSNSVMSDSEGSAVTYTSVYTDSEPGRVFWGTDEEDEDEREPRFIEVHDTDFVPENVFPAEEQPLPPVDSPTVESPGYIAESDPEEDPEYEDDEDQGSPVDYPMGGGDDGGDDDSDSSGDDTDDEDEDMEKDDEDEEEEEEEKHIASADSTAVIPIVELVSSPEGT